MFGFACLDSNHKTFRWSTYTTDRSHINITSVKTKTTKIHSQYSIRNFINTLKAASKHQKNIRRIRWQKRWTLKEEKVSIIATKRALRIAFKIPQFYESNGILWITKWQNASRINKKVHAERHKNEKLLISPRHSVLYWWFTNQ